MTYYNALVYTEYGTVIKYRDITKQDSFVIYCRKYITWTKIFFYKKDNRKSKSGKYCGFIFQNQNSITNV